MNYLKKLWVTMLYKLGIRKYQSQNVTVIGKYRKGMKLFEYNASTDKWRVINRKRNVGFDDPGIVKRNYYAFANTKKQAVKMIIKHMKYEIEMLKRQ